MVCDVDVELPERNEDSHARDRGRACGGRVRGRARRPRGRSGARQRSLPCHRSRKAADVRRVVGVNRRADRRALAVETVGRFVLRASRLGAPSRGRRFTRVGLPGRGRGQRRPSRSGLRDKGAGHARRDRRLHEARVRDGDGALRDRRRRGDGRDQDASHPRPPCPARKVLVLPNGVDIDLFAPLPRGEAIRRRGLDSSCSYVVFTGNFAPWVDFDTMLEAFAKVAADRPNARLLLVGDGPQRQLLDEVIRPSRHRPPGHPHRLRRRPQAVSELVAAATVCLVANTAAHRARTGASPVKVAEYFGAGRAVVGVGLPGTREMIEENGAGIAVPADSDAMAAAIAALLDDPGRADELGAAGRRAARPDTPGRRSSSAPPRSCATGGKARARKSRTQSRAPESRSTGRATEAT